MGKITVKNLPADVKAEAAAFAEIYCVQALDRAREAAGHPADSQILDEAVLLSFSHQLFVRALGEGLLKERALRRRLNEVEARLHQLEKVAGL